MVTGVQNSIRYFSPVFAASCCLTLAAGLLFSSSGDYSPHVLSQIVVVEILFALSGFVFFFGRIELSVPALLCKFLCLFFVTRATGADVVALVCLFSALSFEAFYVSPLSLASLVFVSSAALFTGTRVPHAAWNDVREPLSDAGYAVLLLVGTAWAIAGAGISAAFRSSRRRAQEIRRLEETVSHLTRTNTAWQTYATYIEENSKEEERRRISRDIHDIVGYSMTNLLMIVQAALYSDNQDKITELLQKAQTHINDSLQEVRLAMRKLRSTTKTALHGSDLIRYLAGNFHTVTGIVVNLDFVSFPGKIRVDIEEILYRLMQESMTNSFRHGKATVISVSFWTSAETLTVKIRDNGNRHPEGTIVEGIGIQGMRERIEGVGGTFAMEAVRDGFTVFAKIPLEGGRYD